MYKTPSKRSLLNTINTFCKVKKMTERINAKRMRLIKSVVLAGRYREDTGLISGYVKVHGGKVTGFCDSMPEIVKSTFPGNPILVDDVGNVYQAEDGKWRCKKVIFNGDKIDIDVKQQKKYLAEHIADVLRVEMLYIYRYAERQINDWFNSCKVPLNDNGWRRLEYLKICQAFEAMMSGMPLDSLLVKCKEQ